MFQSTRPRGRTRRTFLRPRKTRGVSIHASSREDATNNRQQISEWTSFNPRVLAGGRDPRSAFDRSHGYVSIHASSREDATVKSARTLTRPSFNPRVLAGGRDAKHPTTEHQLNVSIHASSREDATLAGMMSYATDKVSIHASSREDATALWHRAYNLIWFQSTRPRGRTRLSWRSNVNG